SPHTSSPLEERLSQRVRANWHPLPEVADATTPRHPLGDDAALAAYRPAPSSTAGEVGAVYAIDGSEATRNFSNAAWLIIGQALLIGPGLEVPSLELRLVPGNVPSSAVDSYCSRLMRWLELRLALEHLGRLTGQTLILDGSLYSILPFLLHPLRELKGQLGCADDADLPLRILEGYLDLLEACRRQDVLLLGISKTTQDRVLTSTLLRLPDDLDVISVDMDDQPDGLDESRVPPDAEALQRWTGGLPGFSSPVLLGLQSFGRRRETLISAPEEIAEAFGPYSRYSPQRVGSIIERLRQAPAVATFHVRFAPGEDCLRVDLPAYAIGRADRLVDFSSGLATAEPLEPIVRLLRGCYGGPQVYNAPLYAVDKQVRLSNDMVDGAFLSILRSTVGPELHYNRSARRFL
ncbi:MAG TPA: DNA double-strand break repair nuclease NurA, partial [Chloroflexota bacterium]|nr:DNA double-strand break repair nuclease NurA [Chloroflexota bacterium]